MSGTDNNGNRWLRFGGVRGVPVEHRRFCIVAGWGVISTLGVIVHSSSHLHGDFTDGRYRRQQTMEDQLGLGSSTYDT